MFSQVRLGNREKKQHNIRKSNTHPHSNPRRPSNHRHVEGGAAGKMHLQGLGWGADLRSSPPLHILKPLIPSLPFLPSSLMAELEAATNCVGRGGRRVSSSPAGQ